MVRVKKLPSTRYTPPEIIAAEILPPERSLFDNTRFHNLKEEEVWQRAMYPGL